MREIIPENPGFLPKSLKPREWLWYAADSSGRPKWLVYGCPCGGFHDHEKAQFGFGMLPIDPFHTHVGGAAWVWDGNLEEPTLTPSILHHCVKDWHGFMRAGKLVDA